MARNQEKAQSMLNRHLTMKAEEKKKAKERRPNLAWECSNLSQADKWWNQIMQEIGRKVNEIQNEGLGEHRIRDLNDEINRLIRVKSHWDRRIVELGGPNYAAKHAPKMTDLEGNIVHVPNPSGRGQGYTYFGAAKNLPGVRELFEKPPELRTRYDIYNRTESSCYGYRDDDDGVLGIVEGPVEKKMKTQVMEEWERMEGIRREAKKKVTSVKDVLFEEEEDVVEEEEKQREFVAHVPSPDEKEIERMVLKKKRRELLRMYTSELLLKKQSEAKEMLNINQ